jgi:hypothetical protein
VFLRDETFACRAVTDNTASDLINALTAMVENSRRDLPPRRPPDTPARALRLIAGGKAVGDDYPRMACYATYFSLYGFRCEASSLPKHASDDVIPNCGADQ